MFAALKNHPFAVEAFFRTSLVLAHAAPKEALSAFIPPQLTLDTFKDKWAFIAVALVDTRKLRPKGWPEFTGNNFILVGYRIFVRYRNSRGRSLRGLYILQSQTDSPRMTFAGNIFTHYKYTTTDIRFTEEDSLITIGSVKSNMDIRVQIPESEAQLPAGSPFETWKEARRFSGPLPFTFSVNPGIGEVLIIEGVRQHWEPRPVEVLEDKIDFVSRLNIPGIVLANAFIVQDVPYYWKKGVIDR